jgi:hypothetical protein
MTSISFVVKGSSIVTINWTTLLCECGAWVVSKKKAQRLIGATLYAHRTKSSPSFFSGCIVGYRVLENGRIVFQVLFKPEHCGVVAPGSGWRREQSTVN